MSNYCEVILQWGAGRDQLAAVGAALWRWCRAGAGASGIHRHLDNQALADLIAGRLPVSSQTPRQADPRGVRFGIPDEAARDRRATIESLRRELPAGGVEDVLVNGESWDRADRQPRPGGP